MKNDIDLRFFVHHVHQNGIIMLRPRILSEEIYGK